MRPRLLTAGVGAGWESALVQACQDGGVPAQVVQRCYDLSDLLAAAAAGKADVALVAVAMRWLDREAVARLSAAGLALVGVVPAGDESAERRLRQVGIVHVGQEVDRPATLVDLARAALVAGHGQAARSSETGPASDPDDPARTAGTEHPSRFARSADPSGGAPRSANPFPGVPATPTGQSVGVRSVASRGGPAATTDQSGMLVAVWGPKGSPGRTTVAINLAFESLPLIGETILVDADTYGGTVAQALGFLESLPGLAWAARLAGRGELDAPKLWQATRRAGTAGPRVLAGLPRADLWTEVGPSTWESLLELFRVSFPLTVIDLGFCLEEDEELLYDQVRLRRNAVARLGLRTADVVVAVAKADPVGLHDFVRGYQELRDLGVRPDWVRVVVNQVRNGLFGADTAGQIDAALTRYLGIEPAAFVPYDRAGLDAALVAGQALREARPGSPAQLALALFAASLFGSRRITQPRRRLLRARPRRRRAVLWDGGPSGPTMTFRGTGL